MSNRGDFVGTAPNSGNYIPSPVPADKEDLPVYVNDELLRLGGIVNGVLEGGALPPHSKLPKRFKEGMIMNFSTDVGGGVDSSGVWLYKNDKWWKLIEDPTTITDEVYEKLDGVVSVIDQDLLGLNLELDNLNDNTLPALQAELDDLNDNILPALQGELAAVELDLGNLNDNVIPNIQTDLTQANAGLSSLEGKFPIAETDIQDDSISTPKLQDNSVNTDKIVDNSITGDKISPASTITAGTGNKSASLNGSDPTWRLYAGSSNPAEAPFRVDKDGNLFADSGTFGGTIYARQVSGDLVDFEFHRRSTADTFTAKTRISTIDIAGSDNFDRMLKVDGITFTNPSNNPITVTVELVKDPGTEEVVVNSLNLTIPGGGSCTTGPLLSVLSHVPSIFYVNAEPSDSCIIAQQNISASVIKRGDSITVTA